MGGRKLSKRVFLLHLFRPGFAFESGSKNSPPEEAMSGKQRATASGRDKQRTETRQYNTGSALRVCLCAFLSLCVCVCVCVSGCVSLCVSQTSAASFRVTRDTICQRIDGVQRSAEAPFCMGLSALPCSASRAQGVAVGFQLQAACHPAVCPRLLCSFILAPCVCPPQHC